MTVYAAATIVRALADRCPQVPLFRWDNLAGNIGGIVALTGPNVADAVPTFVIGTGEDDYRLATVMDLDGIGPCLSRDPDPASGACDEPELIREWPTWDALLADPDLPALLTVKENRP